MKMRNLYFAVAIAFVLCACSDSARTSKSIVTSAARSFPTEEELTNAIPVGMSKADLIARYGTPYTELPADTNGPEHLTYMLPGLKDEGPTDWQYVGFSVTLTNGKIAFVGASHRSVTEYRSVLSSEESNVNSGLIQNTHATTAGLISFHAAEDEPVPGGRYVNTHDLPKAGYIRDQPDLVITEIKSVERGQEVFGTGSNDFREVLSVILTETDSVRLAKLTEKLLGKRLLISVGDDPVTAPIVRAPIQAGSFILEVQTPERTARLFNQLRSMAPK